MIQKYLLTILTDNPKEKVEKRQTTLSELKEFVNKSNSIIIHSEYSKILGEKKYINYLKKQFPYLDYTHRNFLFIGNNISETTSQSFARLIEYIAEKYFIQKNSKAKPFNIIIDKPERELTEIKKQLIKLNTKFNDGYEGYGEFSEKFFCEKTLITNIKPKRYLFSVRILSYTTFKTYNTIKNKIQPDMIYIFGNNFMTDKLFEEQIKYFSVDKLELNQISELLK